MTQLSTYTCPCSGILHAWVIEDVVDSCHLGQYGTKDQRIAE